MGGNRGTEGKMSEHTQQQHTNTTLLVNDAVRPFVMHVIMSSKPTFVLSSKRARMTIAPAAGKCLIGEGKRMTTNESRVCTQAGEGRNGSAISRGRKIGNGGQKEDWEQMQGFCQQTGVQQQQQQSEKQVNASFEWPDAGITGNTCVSAQPNWMKCGSHASEMT